jgi:hypothetical protein
MWMLPYIRNMWIKIREQYSAETDIFRGKDLQNCDRLNWSICIVTIIWKWLGIYTWVHSEDSGQV